MKLLSNNIAILENDTHISRWVKESNKLDHDDYILSFIIPLLHEGDTVVDAGAFIGDHTIAYLKKVSKTGNVLAFEPNPESFECLTHNCPDATCINKGLSDSIQSLPFHTDINAGCSRITSSSHISISLTTLDSLNLPRLNYLKLDIEGHELNALKGASSTISTHKPIIFLEVNKSALESNLTSPMQLEDYLNEIGYVFAPIPERGEQYDLLCFPKRKV
jgi:FkbM family methyltransferase